MAGQRRAKLLAPASEPLATVVERLRAVGNIVAAAAECIQRLHAAPLIDREQPIDAGKVRSAAAGDATASTPGRVELGRHPRHQGVESRTATISRSLVSRPT